MHRYGIAVDVTPTARLGFELVKGPYHLENEPGAADMFTTLYEPEPALLQQAPTGVDEIYYRAWHDAIDQLLQSAQYQQFHENTVLDHELSGVCVKPMLEELSPLVDRYHEMHRKQRELDRQRQQLGDTSEQVMQMQQQLEAMRFELYSEGLRVVTRAMQKADQAGELIRNLRAIGYGNEAGRFVKLAIDRQTIDALAQLVKRVAELYGRFMQSMTESAIRSPRKSVMVKGVTLGKSLQRALPSQLAWLSDPDTESLFLLKWLEGRLLVRDLSSPDRRNRGDIVVCVDESASMHGEKAIIAKAYALALREHMHREGRRCHIISFSHRDEDVRELPNDATAEQALDWLQSFIGGGTDFHRPLARALELSTDRSDILIITDGQGELDERFRRSFVEWKQSTGSRLFMVHLERESPLREIADRILELDEVIAALQ